MAKRRQRSKKPIAAATPEAAKLPVADRPPMGRVVVPKRPSQWMRRRIAGLTPGELRSILDLAEFGNTVDLADVFEEMLSDSQVRAALETRLDGVASAKLKVLPAPGGDQGLNAEVAAFTTELFAAARDPEQTTIHGLTKTAYGWSVQEHAWAQRGGVWVSTDQQAVYARDVRFGLGWAPEIRTDGGEWVQTTKEPARWLVHTGSLIGLTPPKSGVLYAALWPWLFKRWATVYQQVGLERFANPLLLGIVEEGARENVIEEMLQALADLRGDQAGVIKKDQDVRLVEPSSRPNDTWQGAIGNFDAAIVKAVLGSTLNTEVGSGGGNRATADSQGKIAIHPRLVTDAASWAKRGLVDQWVRPALRFNRRLFGYRQVEPPIVYFQLTQEAGPQVDDLMLRARAATVDELRESRGWPRWGAENGGDERVSDQVVEKQAEAWIRSAGQGSEVESSKE